MEVLLNAREAMMQGEWEEAKRLLIEEINTTESAELFEELAWASWWLNDAPSVFDYRSKAYKLFLDSNNNLGASRTASWIGLDYLDFKGDFAVASGWFQRAEKLLEGLDNSWELCFIKILKARFTYVLEKNTELSFKLIDESLEISKSIKSIEGEMLAEALKGFIMVIEGNVKQGMPLLDEATVLAVSNEKNDLNFTTITCCYLIDACEHIRDFERAGQWCNTVKEMCKRWRYKAMFANCRVKHAGVLIWKGDWKEAEEELLFATSELKESQPNKVNACTVRLADLRRRQGRWNEAEKLFDEVSHPLKQLFLSSFYYDKGDFENALNLAERYLRRFSVKEKSERTSVVELLIRIHVKLGNLNQARIFLNELEQISLAINTLPMKAAFLSAKGILNSGVSNYEQAKQNLEDAIDIYDKINTPFESMRSRIVLAEVLIKLNKLQQVKSELNTAIEISGKLEARKDLEKVRYILKNLYKHTAGEISKDKDEFTGREIEILKLIVDGKNNKEIADRLFLSIRTVEKHITNIYSKMGISGKSARAYAASYAIKNNIILT